MKSIEKGPLEAAWKQIGIKSHHGIAIPLFGIHTEKSCGIGEFLDLIPFIDWCQTIEMDIIQLLPLNDSGKDSSPYNACSSCALNPIFLSLEDLPYLEEHIELKERLLSFKPLNMTSRIEYSNVLEKKMEWLLAYFEKTGTTTSKENDFQDYVSKNPWVESYALFKTLKKYFNDQSWEKWPQEFKFPNKKEYSFLVKKHSVEVCFYIFLQYLCFQQLKKVKKYAHEKNIWIMGDIPILISPDSADVWHEKEIFNLTMEAGAPPDMYIAEGQNWGFPIYQWDMIEKKGYHFWKQRLTYAEYFFDLYRIDHVVGFFRIWAIPKGRKAVEGKFVPEDENLWANQGKDLLTMLIHIAPKMLPIGEDLGTIPDITRQTLKDLSICGTKVMRWERKWQENSEFIPLEEYIPLSLTTVSTHDSETLAEWWKNSTEEAKVYAAFKEWNYYPEITQEQRKQILWDSHHTPSFFHINPLQEYLAYFPELVSSNLQDERINVPGKQLPTNWSYRFKPTIEQLQTHPYLIRFMRAIHA